MVNLTPKQIQTLMNLINNENNNGDRMTGELCDIAWIIDTGVSHHITGALSCLSNVREVSGRPVGLPNGNTAYATETGDVYLAPYLVLRDVLFVPEFNCSLISVSHLVSDNQCTVQFTPSLCAIHDLPSGTLIGAGERRGGLYFFRKVAVAHVVGDSDLSLFDLWHQRLGHPSEKVVKMLPAVRSSSLRKKLSKVCDICPMAKQTRDSFPVSLNKASRVFELVHCDLWGPYSVPSSCGATYFLTLVDDYSRAVWVSLLHNKTEVYQHFISFCAMVRRQFDTDVKVVGSDNGTEFNCLHDFFTANGILFQTSCTGTPHQNGRVERKHQHILNVSRSLMFQASLPIDFWGECVLAGVHIINRTPSGVLGNITPYEMLFGHAP